MDSHTNSDKQKTYLEISHRCCLGTRPKESDKRAGFLGILTRGSLVKAQASAHQESNTYVHFLTRKLGSVLDGQPTVILSQCHETANAWICARQTTQHDLESVIQERHEKR